MHNGKYMFKLNYKSISILIKCCSWYVIGDDLTYSVVVVVGYW